MRNAYPGSKDSPIALKPQYGNFINGEFVTLANDTWFTNTSPVNASVIGAFPRSDRDDMERARDAAHAAADK
ncbi:hypothetical protein [Erwinia psidii]|nr:hypothetical protein [Erwinia psidii]